MYEQAVLPPIALHIAYVTPGGSERRLLPYKVGMPCITFTHKNTLTLIIYLSLGACTVFACVCMLVRLHLN